MSGVRFWVGDDPQVGVIDRLGRQFCLCCFDRAVGECRPVYAAALLYDADDRCDGCGEHLYGAVAPTR